VTPTSPSISRPTAIPSWFPGEGAFLQIVGLAQKIAPGDLVPVTFTFSNGSSATLRVSTAPPSVPAERSPLNIEEAHE
jgi:hypothetical protein